MTSSAVFDLKDYLQERKRRVDQALEEFFPPQEGPAADLWQAQRYSLLAGGKRLRPILCMAAAAAVGGSEEEVLPVACALECIHTYSLIHDDLPLMDDDDLRRGRPTSHKVFGEAIALLAGDALLTEAFRLMAEAPLPARTAPQTLLKVIALVSRAAGCRGMVAGQVVDIQAEGRRITPETLQYMHTHKTADLIRAATLAGALLGGATESQAADMDIYGLKTGLAFQIADDILDVEGDAKALGKQTGADQARGKATYPALHGMQQSKELQAALIDKALTALREYDQRADPLRHIARYIITRSR